MKPNPGLTAKKLINALAELPPRALLSRKTWHQMMTEGTKKTPRIAQSFTPGSINELQGLTTWTIDQIHDESERFRIAPFGLRSATSNSRQWIIPLTVWQSTGGTTERTNYRPRAATLNGALVTHYIEVSTAINEVPALIGYMLPNNDWGSDAPPEWRVLPESSLLTDFPPLTVSAGEVVLTSLSPSVVQFPQPLVYLPRY